MDFPIILQARMGSRRLPGKVLRPFLGAQPLLGCIASRLSQSRLASGVIVATSVEDSDQPIVDFCKSAGLSVHRGSLNNVAERMREIVKKLSSRAFVRVCADSPFADPRLIDDAILEYERGEWDLVTNTAYRTFPKGLSVQVMRSQTFLENFEKLESAAEQEHVLIHFEKRPDEYRVHNIRCGNENLSPVNLCVDTLQDHEVLSALATQFGGDYAAVSWREVVERRGVLGA